MTVGLYLWFVMRDGQWPVYMITTKNKSRSRCRVKALRLLIEKGDIRPGERPKLDMECQGRIDA